MGKFRIFCAVGVQFLAYVCGGVCFVGTFLFAGKLISQPYALITLGLVTAFLSLMLFSWLAGKIFKLHNTRIYVSAQAGGATIALFLLVWTFLLQPLVPIPSQHMETLPEGVQFWELPTGSRIAVRKIASPDAQNKNPIIFLHGGPGAYAVGLAQTWQAISKLSDSGRDVYLYDQIGGGLSDRLADISQYTMDRHIEDLRAVRQRTGADQVVLIGSSFGATLASV
ncbi:MAG: alpha/beta fold hydrolase [Lysobacterales bacterium]